MPESIRVGEEVQYTGTLFNNDDIAVVMELRGDGDIALITYNGGRTVEYVYTHLLKKYEKQYPESEVG